MAETTEDIASGENVCAEPLQQEVPSETPNIEEPWERKVILSLGSRIPLALLTLC